MVNLELNKKLLMFLVNIRNKYRYLSFNYHYLTQINK